MKGADARQRPAYLRMLVAILLAYGVIITFGTASAAGTARLALLAYLLWTSAHLHADRRLRHWALALGLASVAATALCAILFTAKTLTAVVGGTSVVLIGVCIGAISSTLVVRWRVDVVTVLGVLCIYLLFALFFASVHEFCTAFASDYLNGITGRPTASDLLYFSVITLTTVGFGDITPAAQVARAVTVIEALTGQLYLVSVVAGVVGGWRAAARPGGGGQDT